MKMLLTSHLGTNHRMRARTDDQIDIEFPDYLSMSCYECSVKFKSLKNAQLHYLEEHNIGNGSIKCCETKLKSIPDIKDHIEWHSNPFAFR